MDFEVIFVDTNVNFFIEIQKRFLGIPNVSWLHKDIREVAVKNAAYLLPCDSFCRMNEGYSWVIDNHVFPFISKAAQFHLKKIGTKTTFDNPYLPVGSSCILPIDPQNTNFVICSPSKFLPQDVSSTRNAYHSFMAAVCLVMKFNRTSDVKIHKLVCPGICCGSGKMSPYKSVKQIFEAYRDAAFGFCPAETEGYRTMHNVFITDPKDHEQPCFFENIEIREINGYDLIKKK